MIASIVGIILKLVYAWLDKTKASAEAKEAFLSFIDVMNKEGKISVRLRESGEAQDEELERRKAQINQDKDSGVITPIIDPSKVQVVVPAAVKIGQAFEIQIYGIKDVPFIHVVAERKNPLGTARWSEEKKCYTAIGTFNSVLSGVRTVGVKLENSWLEKEITVSV